MVEGLFDESRKKALPVNPKTVGIITSPSGAAVRDLITVSRRRNSGIKLLLYPVRVQGKEAPGEIAHAIEFMNRNKLAEVLIVGRGGGSIEELWAFNEEQTVRAIAASEIPVVSAVGHETDFTLADFAADKRAATPSQAAEIVVADANAYINYVLELEKRCKNIGATANFMGFGKPAEIAGKSYAALRFCGGQAETKFQRGADGQAAQMRRAGSQAGRVKPADGAGTRLQRNGKLGR